MKKIKGANLIDAFLKKLFLNNEEYVDPNLKSHGIGGFMIVEAH